MRSLAVITEALLAQRGHLMPWVPVCLAIGIGGYFALRFEPLPRTYGGLIGMIALCGLLLRFGNAFAASFILALLLIASGAIIAGWRAHLVAAPVLGWRYYGPVEGRVSGIDRSASDALRLTLDQVVLQDLPPEKTPARVRISLHGDQRFLTPQPGQRVMTTAYLAPPGGPVEPGGFDFQRHSWFQAIGAVGYTRVPLLALGPPEVPPFGMKLRMALSKRVQEKLPGEAGGFVATIMTGDRSGIGQDTLTALRISNLAHLLAISGLHMGLLTGFVYGLLRFGFAAVPWLALRLPVQKLSAVAALAAASFYLVLSGGNVASERAFLMVAVALLAILADRRALSLRAVAVAAIIVLCRQPEALLGPGFQMSFAATTALVAVFALLRDRQIALGPSWLRPLAAVFISSLVAGLATAPIAAAHFNQISHYGLIANLISVPLMGAVLMPMAVAAVCLMPFGLEGLALWIMGFGTDWILGVAYWVSSLPGARSLVPSPDWPVLPLMALGALLRVLVQGWLGWVGVAPLVAAILLWGGTARPGLLIAEGGALVGVMTAEGRALSREKGGGFVARNWLENDGDPSSQERAYQRWPDGMTLGGVRIRHLSGKNAAGTLTDCLAGEWIILNHPGPDKPLPCRVIDPQSLRESGALAVYLSQSGLKEVSVRDVSGMRLWNRRE